MRSFVFVFLILMANHCIYAQGSGTQAASGTSSGDNKLQSVDLHEPAFALTTEGFSVRARDVAGENVIGDVAEDSKEPGAWFPRSEAWSKFRHKLLKHFRADALSGESQQKESAAETDYSDSAISSGDKFHWKPAILQSMRFLAFQHGARMFQKRTNSELGGNFFKDWFDSVKGLRGWEDGDKRYINYIAHPLQGSLTGRIYVNNSDWARRQEFGASDDYWKSRLKAMAWSAAWSTQFELGPISEASIGNVGLREKNGRSRMGYVDLVMTPVAGTGVLIGEDFIDKYVLRNWLERKSASRTVIRLLRTLLTPTTSVANILRWQPPWKRDRSIMRAER